MKNTSLANGDKGQGMRRKASPPLRFDSEEAEADYWDTHSPFDTRTEPPVETVRVKAPKDRPITIRLDSDSRRKLEELARERGLGPSTLARQILMAAIRLEMTPQVQPLEELAARLERSLPSVIRDQTESLLKNYGYRRSRKRP